MTTLAISADFEATERLNLTANATYSLAEAQMESFSLQFPEGVTDPLLPILYDVEAMTGVEEYSDLEYTQLDLNINGAYAVSASMSVTAGAGYRLFDDGEPYVYGDQDGDSYYGNLGIAYRF
ncbi:MAG: hypothetical protein GWN87_30485 [Desulfuromonadales bacterium]|nr:hypothetical protein [Desulfuromonadales bacterium]NIS43894.1 hypothetical protein [Desulfuromonadales bacterium]